MCLLAGCGLFPELEYLSDCQDGCGGTAGQTGSSGAAGTSTGGSSGATAGGKAGASGGNAGSAGASTVGGASGAAGVSTGGAAGNAGTTSGAAGAGAAGTSGSAGAMSGGAAGKAGATSGAAGNAGAASGAAGSSAGASGNSGAAGSAGATAGSNAGGSAGAAGSAVGGAGGAAGGNGGTAGASAGGDGGAGGGIVACPSGRGPSMVRLSKSLGGGCIDSTEVTFAQYQAFLDDGEVDPTAQPAECALNAVVTAYRPTQYIYNTYKSDEAKYGSYAVSGVDWCDARAFCAWSGKALCGKVGGGALPPAQKSSPTDAWWLACATQSGKTYPYGGLTIDGTKRPDTYDKALCHTEDKSTALIRQGPMTPTCEGGVAGVYDLSGNILEWTDSCEPGTAGEPQSDKCALRGGSYNYDGSSVKCTYSQTADRVKPLQTSVNDPNGLYYTVFGFRCCSE